MLLISGTAWSAAIQGDVKGPNGKAIKGAEVRVERTDKKGSPVVTKTDQNGRYVVNNLEVGTYKLQASASGMVAAPSNSVKTRTDGAIRVDFNLKTPLAGAGPATKKKTHKVWVPPGPGTNIGGRYVDVPDDGSAVPAETPGANPASRAGNSTVRSMQQSGGGMPNVGGN